MARKKGLSPNIRAAALRLLYEVEVKGAYTNLLLDKELRHNSWGAADRALLTELVSGTTRMRKHLDWVLDLFLSRSIKKQNPWLRNILRMAAYQLLFLEKIPDYAVVNESVNLARARLGSSVSRLVNAVLRNLVRNRGRLTYPDPRKNPVEYLAVYYSHPEWLVVRWLARYGFDATRGLLEYDNLSPGVTVRTNFLRTDRQALLDSLRADECRCEASLLTPWGVRILNLAGTLRHLDAFRSGWFYVQDEASMLVTPALDPVENQLVYDLTAGVGGKTTHLAEMMNNQGVIRAGELHKGKLDVLRANTARLGITMVEACSCNLLESLPDEWGVGDRVLLDAPCSGLGVLRRRADARWKRSPEDLDQLARLQQDMLNRAAGLVKPGGVLVYSTCTLEPEENEQVVESFLVRHRDFVLEDLTGALEFFPFTEEDRRQAAQGMITLFPPRYGIDGMFIARLRRAP